MMDFDSWWAQDRKDFPYKADEFGNPERARRAYEAGLAATERIIGIEAETIANELLAMNMLSVPALWAARLIAKLL